MVGGEVKWRWVRWVTGERKENRLGGGRLQRETNRFCCSKAEAKERREVNKILVKSRRGQLRRNELATGALSL